MAASMARASTDGLGDAALAAPRPPPRSSFSWRRDHVRSPLSLMRSGRAVSMARTSTGCVCVVARAAPRPPPLCARRSPGGAVITYVVRHRGEAAEAVSMSSSRLDGQRWRCGASSTPDWNKPHP